MSDTAKAPTVEDIAWRVNPEYPDSEIGDVFAEDQYLFAAQQYSKQVCSEHNTLLEIKEILTHSVYQGNDAYAILDDIKRIALVKGEHHA